jgi:hypothetical protein
MRTRLLGAVKLADLTARQVQKVVVDVSGEHYIDHEAEVIGWFMKD